MKTNIFSPIIIAILLASCTRAETQTGEQQEGPFATPTTHPFYDPDVEFAGYAYYEEVDPIERFDLSSGEVYEAELEIAQPPSLQYEEDTSLSLINPELGSTESTGSIAALIITPVQPLGGSSPSHSKNSTLQDGATVQDEAASPQTSPSDQVVDNSPLSSTGFGSSSGGAAAAASAAATEPPSTESPSAESEESEESEDSEETAVSAPLPTATPIILPTETPVPTTSPAITASQALTTTIPPQLANIALRHTVFNERLNLNWALKNSIGTTYAVDNSHTAYQDGLTLAVSPQADFGSLQFTLREDAGVEIQRNRVVGIRFWVYGHDDVIEPGSLHVQVQGNSENSYWTEEETPTSDTSHFIDVDTAVPPRTWVKVEFYINSELLDDNMTYLTGFSIHNNEGFLQTYFIDGVQLLLLRQSDVPAPDTQTSEENQDAG